MKLSEAVAQFRSLDEAVKVGDYVTMVDGNRGHVVSVKGKKVAFTMPSAAASSTETIWTTTDKVEVNPGGEPH